MISISFTAYLWLNWIIAGALFCLGWLLMSALWAAVVGVLSRGRAP